MYERTTPPTIPAIPTTSLQAALALEDNCDEVYLADLITKATDIVERQFSIAVMRQTWTITADGWHDRRHYRPSPFDGYGYGYIALERPPFASITSVTYTDKNDQAQTWTDYHLTTGGQRAKLQPKQAGMWPAIVPNQTGSVVIVYECGRDDAANVPPVIAATIRDVAVYKYEHDCLPTDEWWNALDHQMRGYAARAYS